MLSKCLLLPTSVFRMFSCTTQLLILICGNHFAQANKYSSDAVIFPSAAHFAHAKCMQTSQRPKVTVWNSSHILVSWKNSFQGCLDVYRTVLRVDRRIDFAVSFTEANAMQCNASVRNDPCHTVREVISKRWRRPWDLH